MAVHHGRLLDEASFHGNGLRLNPARPRIDRLVARPPFSPGVNGARHSVVHSRRALFRMRGSFRLEKPAKRRAIRNRFQVGIYLRVCQVLRTAEEPGNRGAAQQWSVVHRALIE
jgi:hypothetical protein